jgi:hypothetical protein
MAVGWRLEIRRGMGVPSTAALSVARMLRNRIAELKAIRDQTRADAGRASGAEHHTAGAQNLRQAGPQAHADQVGGYAAITCARSLSASKSAFRRSGFMEYRAIAPALTPP